MSLAFDPTSGEVDTTTSVPEPTSLLLMGAGVLGMAVVRRRRVLEIVEA